MMKIRTKNKPMAMRRNAWMGVGWGVLGGIAAGGIAAMLLAPKSGKEMRGMIRDRTRRAGNQIALEARREMEIKKAELEHPHIPMAE